MPNDCNNTLVIKGDAKEIKRFVEAVTVPAGEGDTHAFKRYAILQRLYPCPQELSETKSGWFANNEDGTKCDEQIALEAQQEQNISKYGHKDWYDWCTSCWGTKWGDYETDLDYEEGSNYVTAYFQSAWSPPTEAFVVIAQMFPTLTFILSYQETGCGFVGAVGYLNDFHYESFSEDISIPEIGDGEDSFEYWDIVDDAYNSAQEDCVLEVKEILRFHALSLMN